MIRKELLEELDRAREARAREFTEEMTAGKRRPPARTKVVRLDWMDEERRHDAELARQLREHGYTPEQIRHILK